MTRGRHAQRDRGGLPSVKLARTTTSLSAAAGHPRAFEERNDMPLSAVLITLTYYRLKLHKTNLRATAKES